MWWGGVVGAGVRKLLAQYFIFFSHKDLKKKSCLILAETSRKVSSNLCLTSKKSNIFQLSIFLLMRMPNDCQKDRTLDNRQKDTTPDDRQKDTTPDNRQKDTMPDNRQKDRTPGDHQKNRTPDDHQKKRTLDDHQKDRMSDDIASFTSISEDSDWTHAYQCDPAFSSIYRSLQAGTSKNDIGFSLM